MNWAKNENIEAIELMLEEEIKMLQVFIKKLLGE